MAAPVLIVPGFGNSGMDHWQTFWEAEDASMMRLRVADWERPVCSSWVESIDAQARPAGASLVIAAHSLGCLAVAQWSAQRQASIRGALFVAVPDPGGPHFPRQASGFSTVPMEKIPFRTIVVSSEDDPYGNPEFAKSCADAWGSAFVTIGRAGHINSASKLGRWLEGQELLRELR
jgi:predicted alpha/beta hydrolase family esterase